MTAKKAEEKSAGDELPGDEKQTALETELGMPIGGDSKVETRGSDDFMKDIWG